MKTALLFITDGREYADRALDSVAEMTPAFDKIVRIGDADHSLGFAGAIEAGWKLLREEVDADWVFHMEDDFLLNKPVPLEAMIGVLERWPYLAQMSLKRQPWNEQEKAAGGIVEQSPDDFEQWADTQANWVEHRRYFTTNPSVYSAKLCERGWPQVRRSEGIFTHQLLEDPDLRFAIWGEKFGPPACTHIGEERAGDGY